MHLVSGEPGAPLWPPLLATRGPGGLSAGHSHHAMHLVLAVEGTLRIRLGTSGRWRRAAGVLTTPDVLHALDARGVESLLVFIDPESVAGAALLAVMHEPLRLVSGAERALLLADAEPLRIMQTGGVDYVQRVVSTLGGQVTPRRSTVHPRVRRVLAQLRAEPEDPSLEGLARRAGLSPGRFMHVFTESIGIPLRPYLGWLRLQRAAAAIVGGESLSAAAATAGFSDAAHMTRTFRRTFGMTPSALRSSALSQPVRSRPAPRGSLP